MITVSAHPVNASTALQEAAFRMHRSPFDRGVARHMDPLFAQRAMTSSTGRAGVLVFTNRISPRTALPSRVVEQEPRPGGVHVTLLGGPFAGETAQNPGVTTPHSEADNVPDARRQHKPC
jgi:hypothetical protein